MKAQLMTIFLASTFIIANAQNDFPSSGNVRIGLSSAEVPLHVGGDARFNGSGWFGRTTNGALTTVLSLGQNAGWDYPIVALRTQDNGGSAAMYLQGARWSQQFIFSRESSTGPRNAFLLTTHDAENTIQIMKINGADEGLHLSAEATSWFTGNVIIGRSTPAPSQYKFAVAGNMITESLQVQLVGSWSDYVFAKNYALRPLSEVEKFINQYQHLPDLPSAAEVKKDGINIAEMDATLLKKIEELTLYVIDLKKEVDRLKAAANKEN